MSSIEVLKQCRDALETAKNGLTWYRDRCTDAVDGSDDEASTEIDEALTSADAALSAAPVDEREAREAFERLTNRSRLLFRRGGSGLNADIPPGDYVDSGVQHQWEQWLLAWEAARASLASPAPAQSVPPGWAFYSADFSMKAHESAATGRVLLVRTGDDFRAWFNLSDEDRDQVELYVAGDGPTIHDAIANACKAAQSAHGITGEQHG